MMRVRDLWAEYSNLTKQLTESARKLGYAAAAICWFFKGPEITFPILIVFSLAFIAGFFIFDILQLFIGLLLLRFWTNRLQRRIYKLTGSLNLDMEVGKPRWVVSPSFACYILKIFCLLCAYGMIAAEMLKRISG